MVAKVICVFRSMFCVYYDALGDVMWLMTSLGTAGSCQGVALCLGAE